MPRVERRSLLSSLGRTLQGASRSLCGPESTVDLAELASGSALRADPLALRSRSLLIHTRDPLCAAVALVELDGVARRIVLCPPAIAPEYLPAVATMAQIDGVVSGAGDPPAGLAGVLQLAIEPAALSKTRAPRADDVSTEWILLTSGTSGVPKLVVHTLATLSGAIASTGPLAGPLVWSTFYDIRRYGGLQILLRALLGGGSLVLTDAGEPMDQFLARAARCGVTHITGTPSHWRRALMSASAHELKPLYARMSGEIADQAIIDRLRACYPQARVAHAFASTEAGVGFEVDDGLEGFPRELVERTGTAVEIKVEQDTLRIRSALTGLRYLGAETAPLQDEQGFVDTGDVVVLRGGRYYFVGRRGGIINVGGLKVHPEEVEAVINRHPRVRMSLVKARKNPITGSLVVAEVVRNCGLPEQGDEPSAERVTQEILDLCRANLAPYKVPALIRIVAGIDMTPSGKLTRAAG